MLISTADICALHRTDARTYTCMHTRAGTYARAHAFRDEWFAATCLQSTGSCTSSTHFSSRQQTAGTHTHEHAALGRTKASMNGSDGPHIRYHRTGWQWVLSNPISSLLIRLAQPACIQTYTNMCTNMYTDMHTKMFMDACIITHVGMCVVVGFLALILGLFAVVDGLGISVIGRSACV